MTISEAINRIDSLKHNTYSELDKVLWISDLDGKVKLFTNGYEGADTEAFPGYNADTDPETELLIPAPYDEAYLRWLEARIDYQNGEYARYNNSIIAFNSVYDAFRNHYNRTHMPVGKSMKFF